MTLREGWKGCQEGEGRKEDPDRDSLFKGNSERKGTQSLVYRKPGLGMDVNKLASLDDWWLPLVRYNRKRHQTTCYLIELNQIFCDPVWFNEDSHPILCISSFSTTKKSIVLPF